MRPATRTAGTAHLRSAPLTYCPAEGEPAVLVSTSTVVRLEPPLTLVVTARGGLPPQRRMNPHGTPRSPAVVSAWLSDVTGPTRDRVYRALLSDESQALHYPHTVGQLAGPRGLRSLAPPWQVTLSGVDGRVSTWVLHTGLDTIGSGSSSWPLVPHLTCENR